MNICPRFTKKGQAASSGDPGAVLRGEALGRARSLHGMLELDGVPEELKEYVEDYSLHILTSAIRRTSVSGISAGGLLSADVHQIRGG